MARTIPLSKGAFALVDDDDYEWLSEFNWHLDVGGYAVRSTPRVNGKRWRVSMHRAILGVGPWVKGGEEVDHIDRNRLNNQRANLRIVTHQGNALNRDNRKLPDFVCPVCGGSFTPGKASRIYCSLECFGKRPDNPRTQRVLEPRACPTCREEFQPRLARTKYCSLSCRSKGRWMDL